MVELVSDVVEGPKHLAMKLMEGSPLVAIFSL